MPPTLVSFRGPGVTRWICLSDLVGCCFGLPFRRVLHAGEDLVVPAVLFRRIFAAGGLFVLWVCDGLFFVVISVSVCFRF